MKKSLLLVLLSFSLLILSGCSLGTGSSSSSSSQSSTISKSIWKSADGGKTWNALTKVNGSARASDPDVLSFAINPSDSRTILAGLKAGGILKTEDVGDSWIFTSFTSQKVYGLAIDPANARVVYASGVVNNRGKLFKSEDFGENWKEIYTSASDGQLIISLTIDKKDSKVIYATTSNNQIIKSMDGGDSWKNIYEAAQPVLRVAIDAGNSNLVYFLVMNGSLIRSNDGGNNMEDIKKNFASISAASQKVSVLEADPTNPNSVYLGGGVGLIKSQDGGNTWSQIRVLSDSDTSPITALAINPRNANELIYGAGQATYKSVDSGVTWSTSQFDIKKNIRLIQYDPNDSNMVYMGFNK